jgi:FAD/FMN-containing dehydrogenase
MNPNHPFETADDRLPSGLDLWTSGPVFDQAIFIGNELYSQRRPAYVIQPRTIEDVASALQMVRDLGLPVSIKCGGHSYAGYCLNSEGVVLDLSLMQQIEIDESTMTVRVAGGVRWLSVYEALAKVNPRYVVMGGICPDVGIGGAVLGGGINLMSRTFGLAIDSLQAV